VARRYIKDGRRTTTCEEAFMRTITTTYLTALSIAAVGCGTIASDATSKEGPVAQSGEALSASSGGLGLRGLAHANAKVVGRVVPNALSPELIETIAAQGATAVENPATVTLADGSTIGVSHYGYNDNGPMIPLGGDVQSATHNVEANKTEPDKNTYLVLDGQAGADATYDYGTHFLYQGHETGAVGVITRINLDADADHRVTLLATTDAKGKNLPTFDGSTFDPWANRLLFTTESLAVPGVFQATLDVPSRVEDLAGSMGRGGFEGIQNDAHGNVWIVEDVGGAKGIAYKNAKQPNSFLYRFVPTKRSDLAQGKLQALQVISLRTGQPIVFHAGQADLDIKSDDVLDLHTYGKSFKTRWVTIHDTAVDGTDSFDANALAKQKLATPFKRPENGLFRPGSDFGEFLFDETGDTDQRSEAGAEYGGFGGLFRLHQSCGADDGTLSLLYRGDLAHTGFDNVAFWTRDHVVFVEDAGDTLHTQRNALDSGFLFDVRADYANPANQPLLILAEGRDTSATIDSSYQGQPGFHNEGDNEITGIHVSNGDASVNGILGAQIPRALHGDWRVFFTQQHGDNFTWEILRARN
jgi:hypothetical protein